jgi:flagellar biosynthesis protein FlhG
MTRIMTITSGVPGAGKTQLAINIALELVRRGRQVGVFYARESASPVEKLLKVQQPVNMLRRADDPRERGLLRSGYQGIDIVSCGTPLREWPTVQADQRALCIQEMEVKDGYDDFLIDTSGMDARTLLACCRASGVVVLVVTPEPQSHAEAFALIRVLQLNGFAGLFRLIVNKVSHLVDAEEIHDEFFRQVNTHLGLNVPLLGVLLQDEALLRAQRVRQAFTSIFPESNAASGIIGVVEALDELPRQLSNAPRSLSALWHTLIDVIQLPVTLSGEALLHDQLETTPCPEPLPEEPLAEQDSETGLLQFQGNLDSLRTLRDSLQGNFQVLLEDVNTFVETTELDSRVLQGNGGKPLQREQMINLVSRLLKMIDAACPLQSFRFQVTDTVVNHPDKSWLQPGRYLKYGFHMMRSELPDTAHILLLNVPAITMTAANEGGTMYELINAAGHCCLNIISDPQEGVRMQLWLSNETQQLVQSLPERRIPAG